MNVHHLPKALYRQALTLRLLWEGLKDYDLWPMYAIGLLFGIPGYPLSNYFQISMSQSPSLHSLEEVRLLMKSPSLQRVLVSLRSWQTFYRFRMSLYQCSTFFS